jgi:hypothetical protein
MSRPFALDELYRTHVPGWAQDSAEGAPILYTLGKLANVVAEHARDGIAARFPLGPTLPGETPRPPARDALSLIARDRGKEWGINEEPAAFGARLIPWLDDARRRGNPFQLMRELRGYCNAAVRIRTVDARSNWCTLDRDGTETYQPLTETGIAWNWDGAASSRWGRFWVIIYPTADLLPWGPGPVWGDPTWGAPGTTWGTTATIDQVATVRRIVRDWKPAGTRCEHIIIAFDDTSFNPVDSFGMPTAGNWNQAKNRNRTARYWRGTRDAA